MIKVFCITCHKVTNPLVFTINYLASFENNKVIVHVDKKTNISNFNINFPSDVVFIKDRIDVKWGTHSQIESFVKLLDKAVKYNPDFTFMLSGDDLPCMTNEEIDILIRSSNYKNLIHYQDARNKWVNPLERVKYIYPRIFYLRDPTFVQRLIKKTLKQLHLLRINKEYILNKDKIDTFYKGSNWFGLNNNSLNKMISFIRSNVWYIKMFEKSLCGDEVFFHTLLKHLKIEDCFHDSVRMNDALRYIDWNSGPEYPKILDVHDLEKIANSNCIFARKFSEDFDCSNWEDFITNKNKSSFY